MFKRKKEVVAAVVGCLLFMGVAGLSVHWAFERMIKMAWVEDAILRIQRLDRSIGDVQSQLKIFGECLVANLDPEDPTDTTPINNLLNERLTIPLGLQELVLRNVQSGKNVFIRGQEPTEVPEDLWRASLFDLKHNRQSVTALERTEYGPRILALVPIYDTPWVLELTAQLKDVLDIYSRREGCDVAMFVGKKPDEFSLNPSFWDSYGNRWGLVLSSNPSMAQNLLLINQKIAHRQFRIFDKAENHYGAVFLDGVEYQSKSAPCVSGGSSFLLWSDYTSVVHAYQEAAGGIIAILWITAGLFGGMVGYFGLKYRRQAKAKIDQKIEELSCSNISYRSEVIARQRAEEKLRGVAESIYLGRCEDQAILSQLSHSLKVTASGIVGFGSLSLENAQDDEQSDTALEFIQAGSQILRQAENLEVWAQRDFYKGAASASKQMVGECIEDILKNLKQWAQRKNIKLELDIEDCLMLSADRLILDVALKNIISNAIKYAPLGSVVEIRAQSVSSGVQISVVDKGEGISREKMESLFELSAERLAQGTAGEEGVGMGLILVKWACDILKAKLRIISDSGQGCRAVLSFDADA